MTRKKLIVLVGQAPGARGCARAFDGPGFSGERFPGLLGLSRAEFLAEIDTVNLLGCYSGKDGKGDVFDLQAGKLAAAALLDDRCTGTMFLLAGRNVARSFGVSADYFKRVQIDRHVACIVPHPSGVNRWWNEPANVCCARRFLRDLWREVLDDSDCR